MSAKPPTENKSLAPVEDKSADTDTDTDTTPAPDSGGVKVEVSHYLRRDRVTVIDGPKDKSDEYPPGTVLTVTAEEARRLAADGAGRVVD